MRTTATLLLILAFGAVPAFAAPVVRPDHVVIVVMENKRYDAVIGHAQTPYISELAKQGANFSNAYGETHPSQPNYLAFFSGSTQGVSDNRCKHSFTAVPNLATQLLQTGRSFTGYAEGLPSVGWTGCSRGQYVRRHNPWVNFTDVPATSNRPMRDFPTDFSRLPTVSFIVPGLCHDMHDCPKANADTWLRTALGGYLAWANTHNSVLILTFDEDNKTDQQPHPDPRARPVCAARQPHRAHRPLLAPADRRGLVRAAAARRGGATPATHPDLTGRQIITVGLACSSNWSGPLHLAVVDGVNPELAAQLVEQACSLPARAGCCATDQTGSRVGADGDLTDHLGYDQGRPGRQDRRGRPAMWSGCRSPGGRSQALLDDVVGEDVGQRGRHAGPRRHRRRPPTDRRSRHRCRTDAHTGRASRREAAMSTARCPATGASGYAGGRLAQYYWPRGIRCVACSARRAFDELRRCAGTQSDPAVLPALEQTLNLAVATS